MPVIPRREQPPPAVREAVPFWHRKHPDSFTPDERRRYAALQFQMVPALEHLLLVRELHPEIARLWTTDRQLEIDAYAKQRRAKIELGEWKPPEPDPAAVDEIHAAAAVIAGPRPRAVGQVDVESRAAFRQAVHEGDWSDVRDAYASWLAALDGVQASAKPWAQAHHALGLRYADMGAAARRPRFTDEVDDALGSPKRSTIPPVDDGR